MRHSLYVPEELLDGFDPADPASLARTLDFRSYRYFVRSGRAAPHDPYADMMQALHDNSVARAMYAFLAARARPTAAIMGGHREPRGSGPYRQIAALAKRLTEGGFLMASGGGPGAMEATHLGALLAGRGDGELDDALELLAGEPVLPHATEVVDPSGRVSGELVAALHRWTVPAVTVRERYRDGGESLAVPTWHYGHEPFSPLASHIAKYFLNSIREDVLLALATNGIVYTPGRAGTLQEVFQDAAQNYYATEDSPFAPMVFLGVEFWTRTLPVDALLESLFALGGQRERYREMVLFTDDLDAVVEFLTAKRPAPAAAAARLSHLGFGNHPEDAQW
ncbi:hypothetical protein NUM3379_26690 [Kineococcus sp. NUM-3379]